MQSTIETRKPRRNPLRPLIWGGAACLLLLPLVAMQFTDEVAWSGGDFMVFGGMLLLACGAWELAVRLSASLAYRAGFGIAIAATFLMTWVNLAVGIIGDGGHAANLAYFGVPVIGAIAAALGQGRPVGMARAMVVTAVAQGLVGVYAAALGSTEGALFAVGLLVAWLASAYFFRKSAVG